MTVLWFGMIWDCLFTSKMPIRSKVLWFILLIPTSTIGGLIYYLRVYKNRLVQNTLPEEMQISP